MTDEQLFTITYDDEPRWIVQARDAEEAFELGAGMIYYGRKARRRAETDEDLVDRDPGKPSTLIDPDEAESLGARPPTPAERAQWDRWAGSFAPGSTCAPAAMPLDRDQLRKDEQPPRLN